MIKLFILSALFAGATISASVAAGPEPVAGSLNAASEESSRRVMEKARAFLASLSPAQRSAVIVPYSFSSASRWSNLPEYAMWRGRVGLSTSTLTEAQWQSLNDLLAAATGSRGYEEIQQILNSDDFVSQFGKRREGYGRGHYHIAFLGEPDSAGRWQLQFGGHHIAVNHTYMGEELIGATPAFRGAEPMVFDFNGVPNRPMAEKHAAFVSLISSLDAGQAKAARFRRSPGDLVAGPGDDWAFPDKPYGIPAARLSAEQRDRLRVIIELYVQSVDDANAARIMATYERELDRTHFGFSGTGKLDRAGDYVRIDGPSVWIEMVMDEPFSFSAPHPHSVWRDKVTDYGGHGR
jgi:hypothetical protein